MLATMMISRKTTAEERKLLRDQGFVHVTGLTESQPDGSDPSVIGGENGIPANQLGRYYYGTGTFVIVTEGGEVWLGASGERARFNQRVDPLVEKLCPNGRGGSAPRLDGKEIAINDLLDRLANPDFQPFPR